VQAMPSNARVPLEVRICVNELLFGPAAEREERLEADKSKFDGLWGQKLSALAKSTECLEMLRTYRDMYSYPRGHLPDLSNDSFVQSMLSKRQDLLNDANRIGDQIEAVERLANPDRMGEAYHLLQSQFKSQQQWSAFFNAALLIRCDFGAYRSLGKDAQLLSRQISDAARDLAKLVQSIRGTGVGLPRILMPSRDKLVSEWASIDGSPEHRDLAMKRFVRDFIRECHDNNESDALDIHTILIELSEQCATYQPDFMDQAIESALSSRQQSRKSATLRAFATSLREKQIGLTPQVKKAMAIAANTVLDDPEEGITEDHVRKALASLPALKRTTKRSPTKSQRKSRVKKRL